MTENRIRLYFPTVFTCPTCFFNTADNLTSSACCGDLIVLSPISKSLVYPIWAALQPKYCMILDIWACVYARSLKPRNFFLRHAERYNGQLRYESPFPSCAQFWHRQLEIHNNSKGKKQLTNTHQLVAASARRGCFMEPGVAQSAGLDRLITKCFITGTPVPKKVNTPAPLLLLQLQEDTLPSLNPGSPGNSANLWTHLEVCVKPRDDTDHTNPEVKWRQLFV